jgi:ubiquinone biosynthesis protein COQ9
LEKKASKIDLSKMKVRDKIKKLVKTRLLIEENNRNSLKSLITLSKGKRIPNLVKNNYNIAGLIWTTAGDSSTDFNFYTKRLILSKVFARTFINFVNDESEGFQDSWNFLDDQIDKVMKIGQIKMKIKNCTTTACNLKENIKELPFLRLLKNKHK